MERSFEWPFTALAMYGNQRAHDLILVAVWVCCVSESEEAGVLFSTVLWTPAGGPFHAGFVDYFVYMCESTKDVALNTSSGCCEML